MGPLTLAKAVADQPAAASLDELKAAFEYLTNTRRNGGVRNSERAGARLERRLARLEEEIARRTDV